MEKKLIPEHLIREIVSVAVIATAAFIIGLLFNQLRNPSLPLVFESKSKQIEQAVNRLSSKPSSQSHTEVMLAGDVSLVEVRKFSEAGGVTILDARPEIFHRLGHIPNAISLPREDFENAYSTLREQLEENKAHPIILYCSNSSCEDSELVLEGLMSLGYTNIGVFRGGWSEWKQAGLPEETNEE